MQASRDGYFAPDSVIRRVGNTPVTPFLGGGTAVLLQVAHPLVAAGVADHSDYHHDLWRRLARTLRALYPITFGTNAEAERAGAAVQAVHAHVRGTTRTRLGSFPAGTPYSADDPELSLWVHATLVHASLSAYQRLDHRLSRVEQESYYRGVFGGHLVGRSSAKGMRFAGNGWTFATAWRSSGPYEAAMPSSTWPR